MVILALTERPGTASHSPLSNPLASIVRLVRSLERDKELGGQELRFWRDTDLSLVGL